MCGRFVVSYTYDELVKMLEDDFSIFDVSPDLKVPNYNVAPGTQVISIISDGAKYRVGTFKWGLVPEFATSETIGYKMINARSETVYDKPSFKQSILSKRCIVLSNGFYEWDKLGDNMPYYISMKDKSIFAYAGIWSKYKAANGNWLYTCSILTVPSNESISDIHERMPVILDIENSKKWLGNLDVENVKKMMIGFDPSKLTKHRVSEIVNKVQHNSPDNIKPYNDYKLF